MNISQIAAEPGIGVNVLSRWQRELRQEQHQAFTGHGRSRDEEVGHPRQELARGTEERDCLRKAAACFARASR
ncbi:MAG: hypothetical protein ABIU05_09415 [Nitrospirales bacterium]